MKTAAIKFKMILMLSAMFVVFGANAQNPQGPPNAEHPGPNPEEMAKKMTEWMKTELSLTNDQTPKVEKINLSYANRMKEIMEQMHKQMKSLEDEKLKEMGNVLTKEQLTKLEAKKEEMKGQRKEHHMKGKDWEGKEGCPKKKEDK
jgi:Spy/CpxP family protein refolding chaperone